MPQFCRYQPQPSSSIDKDKLQFDHSSYHAQTHSIIVK